MVPPVHVRNITLAQPDRKLLYTVKDHRPEVALEPALHSVHINVAELEATMLKLVVNAHILYQRRLQCRPQVRRVMTAPSSLLCITTTKWTKGRWRWFSKHSL